MKSNMKKILFLTAVFISGFMFTACHDDIYDMIIQEVHLEDYGITGEINSIVRFKDTLLTANGNVYQKSAVPSSVSKLYNQQWKRVIDSSTTDSSSVFYKQKINYLASDSDYVYALSVKYQPADTGHMEPESVRIFYSDNGTEWKVLDNSLLSEFFGIEEGVDKTSGVDVRTYFPLIRMIFDNQAVDVQNRNAYVNIAESSRDSNGTIWREWKLYKLNGGNKPVPVENKTNGAEYGTKSATEKVTSSSFRAVYYKGQDYFSSYYALSANDSYIYFAKNKSIIYCADGWDETNGYTFNGSSPKEVKADAGIIRALCPTKDFLMIGTDTGVAHVPFTDGIPSADTAPFANNAVSALTSSYIVYTLFALDPSLNEYDTDLYGAIDYSGGYSTSTNAIFKDLGLWAYYPDRGNWNKDGTSNGVSGPTPAGN